MRSSFSLSMAVLGFAVAAVQAAPKAAVTTGKKP